MSTKKILVFSELDELSAKVTKFAVGLSSQLGETELILLNVIIPAMVQSFTTAGAISTYDNLNVNLLNTELMNKHRMLADIEAMKYTTDKVNVIPIVRFNESQSNIQSIMESLDASLLVLGSHDETSFLNQLFGANSIEIVRKADFPTIVIKPDTRVSNINNLLVALDVNEEDQSGLREVADLAQSLQARVNLLYVVVNGDTSPDTAIEKMHDLALLHKMANYAISVISSPTLEEGIKGFIRKTNPDMMAVLSQGKGKIKKLIYGSSAEDIIKEVNIPVLINKIH
jgi:nucleotide-binding universal stress UspA family protein